MANEIEVGVSAKLDKIEAQLKGLETTAKISAEKFGENIAKGIEGAVGKSMDSLKHQILSVVALLTSGVLFHKMIENASEAEDAISQLNASMRNAGTFSVEASNKFQEYSHQLETTTGISDDLINRNAALLVSIGNLSGQGLERATKAALDLSAGLRIDLESAFTLIAKASAGSTEALSRYGIKVDEHIPKNERFAAVLDLVNQKLGGLADERLNTFSGAITKLGVSFNNVFEEMGKLITQSPVVRDLIKFTAAQFEKLAEGVSKFGSSGDKIGDITKKLLELALTITELVGPPIELFVNSFITAFKVIRSALQELLVVPFAKLISGIADVGQAVGVVSKETANNLRAFADSATEVSQEFNAASEESASKMFDFDVTAAADNLIQRLQIVADTAKPAAKNIGKNIKEGVQEGVDGVTFEAVVAAMDDAKNKIIITADSIARHLNQSFVGGISNAFASFGKALGKGKNAFESFGKSVLSAMGQMLIFFGQMLIAIGIGLSTVPFLFGLQGGAAIAAGIAATVLGGFLMALGEGGETAGAGAGGTIGGSAGGGNGPGQNMEDVASLKEQKPQTNINIQVQGNILDRRQTGLELAEVIQETFGTQGITYKTA